MKRTFTLGRFHCVERLGSGPIHETWRAKLYGIAGIEQQFLIKRVHAHLLSDRALVERLQAACALYQGLESPGVLRLREVEHKGQQCYLVLDFAGTDLSRLPAAFRRHVPAETRVLLPGVVAALGGQVAATLSGLHGQGILHGGICPQAVCLDGEGRALLTDVAILRARQEGHWQGEPEMAPLLPYVAPEVLRGEPADARSEVYSLGVVLFEVLHGALPFSGAHKGTQGEAGEVVYDAGALSALPEDDGALDKVLFRALCARPSGRHGSMAEFLADLSLVAADRRSLSEALLRRLARRLQRSEVPDPVAPSTVSEGADPLPPPPLARTEDGHGVPPSAMSVPLPMLAPPRGADGMRDAPSYLAGARSGPVAVAVPRMMDLGVGSGRIAGVAALRAEAQPTPLPVAPPAGAAEPIADEDSAARRLASPSAGVLSLFARSPSPPSSAFADDSEESTVPVPHSPKSKIMTIDAETPLPRSIPLLGTNPGVEVTAVSDGRLPKWSSSSSLDSGPTMMADLPALPVPGAAASQQRKQAEETRTQGDGNRASKEGAGATYEGARASREGARTTPGEGVRASSDGSTAPSGEIRASREGARTTPGEGTRTPLARVFPGRPRPTPNEGNGIVQKDDSDLVTAERLAAPLSSESAGLARRLGDPSCEVIISAGTPPPGQRPARRMGQRPAGFTDFDEPTALADYGDSSLAGLMSLSSRDKSGPVVGNPSREVKSVPPRAWPPGVGALSAASDPTEARRFSLADAYAPLITAPVALASPDDLQISVGEEEPGDESAAFPAPATPALPVGVGAAGPSSGASWAVARSGEPASLPPPPAMTPVPAAPSHAPASLSARTPTPIASGFGAGGPAKDGPSARFGSPVTPGSWAVSHPSSASPVASGLGSAVHSSTGTPSQAGLSTSSPRPLTGPEKSLPVRRGDPLAEVSPVGSWPLPPPTLSQAEAPPTSAAIGKRGTAAIVLASFVGSSILGICIPLLYRAGRRGKTPVAARGEPSTRVTPSPEVRRAAQTPVRPGVATLSAGPDPRRTEAASPKLSADRQQAPLAQRPPAPAQTPDSPTQAPDSPTQSPGPASQRPERQGPGKLLLSSIPPAAIFIDGKPGGHTPTTLAFADPGAHHLILVAEKRKIWRQDIEAGPPLSITLEPATLGPPVAGKAGLKVRCASKGKLRILVDNIDTGMSCPSSRLGLSPGTHQIAFVDPVTGSRQTQTVVVKDTNKSVRLYTKF